MKKAEYVSELLNSFDAGELSGEDLDKFYYGGTMIARTGRKGKSPMDRLYEACTHPCMNSSYLLLGHRGCGKSTELNKMAEKLRGEGYEVVTIQCNDSLDFNNPIYADLLVLMCDSLLKMAGECHYDIPEDIRRTVAWFWADAEQAVTRKREEETRLGSNISVEAPALPIPVLKDLLSLGVSVKNAIRFREDSVAVYRSRISRRIGEWIAMLNRISDGISEKLDGKRPIIIFEDLDKLDQMDAEHVFFERTSSLTGYNFPIIYTFPIALSYDGKFTNLKSQFKNVFRFPMMKIETETGDIVKEGYLSIRRIVDKRAKLELFEGSEFFTDESSDEDNYDRSLATRSALFKMIQKTGGSLRDLFEVIREASVLARDEGRSYVSIKDVEEELIILQSELTLKIESKNYPFLATICNGSKRQIENREMLLQMMQAGVVLEYNGRQWHNVHPLVRDFLEEEQLL